MRRLLFSTNVEEKGKYQMQSNSLLAADVQVHKGRS
jgi:hypothetical protein